MLAGMLPNRFKTTPDKVVGLVLGTGLSHLANALEKSTAAFSIPFEALPGFPASSVKSHRGAFVGGEINNCLVLAQAGRVHLYEGRSPAEVCMGVRVMRSLGLTRLVLTNAAGSLNPLFPAGTLMCVADMINLTGTSPLTGENHEAWGPRFPDFSRVFPKDARALARREALALGIELHEGVYIGVHGPELETPAETRMYRSFGADAIGMSTVLEAACAKHMGMKILAISCLTNQNLPDCMAETTLDDIIAAANACEENLSRLLAAIMPPFSALPN